MKSIYLEAFLVFDIFLAGAVAATALRHAYAHFRPREHDDHDAPVFSHLPASVREKLLEDAQANFEAVLRSTTRDLQKDLAETAEQIKKHIEETGNEARDKEIAHYKATLAELQNKTKEDIEGMDKDLAGQKTELRAKLAEEMATEKQKLISQIDTKLADAVTSFLLDALGHDVDLGAQSAYLTKMLDEHKADFIREVSGEEA